MPISESSERSLRYAVLSGPFRSGTTLLANLVNAHPNASFTIEYGFEALVRRIGAIVDVEPAARNYWTWPAAYLASQDRHDADLEGIARFYVERQTHEVRPRPTMSSRRERFDAIARAFYESTSDRTGLAVVGDKVPIVSQTWQDLDVLLTAVPQLKFVFVIRNPIGTINSALIRTRRARLIGDTSWFIADAEDACRRLRIALRTIAEVRKRMPDAVHLVKYEDLCVDHHVELARIHAFLELPAAAIATDTRPLPEGLTILSGSDKTTIERSFRGALERWSDEDAGSLLDLVERLPHHGA